MNRGYTRERYLELVAEIRDAVPEMALSTDLIVGFPGETDADFDQTLDMVETVGYDNVFVFRYSRRPGTPAATMPDQVADDVKASAQYAAPGGRPTPGGGPSGAAGSRAGRWTCWWTGSSKRNAARAAGPDPLQSGRQLRRAGARVRR